MKIRSMSKLLNLVWVHVGEVSWGLLKGGILERGPPGFFSVFLLGDHCC